jgi:hypothetical protein
VTTWGPVGIAQLAERAGVPNAELPVVVALALAASGGRDHFHYVNPIDPSSERWGLWALPDPQWGSVSGPDLWDPVVSAKTLMAKSDARGDGYTWHESWGPLGHEVYLPLVVATLAGAPRRARPEDGGSFADKLDRIVHRARAMAGRLEQT